MADIISTNTLSLSNVELGLIGLRGGNAASSRSQPPPSANSMD